MECMWIHLESMWNRWKGYGHTWSVFAQLTVNPYGKHKNHTGIPMKSREKHMQPDGVHTQNVSRVYRAK
eukprot:10006889-Karenia_brevis.AAC.1